MPRSTARDQDDAKRKRAHNAPRSTISLEVPDCLMDYAVGMALTTGCSPHNILQMLLNQGCALMWAALDSQGPQAELLSEACEALAVLIPSSAMRIDLEIGLMGGTEPVDSRAPHRSMCAN